MKCATLSFALTVLRASITAAPAPIAMPIDAVPRNTDRAQSSQIGPTCASTRNPTSCPVPFVNE